MRRPIHFNLFWQQIFLCFILLFMGKSMAFSQIVTSFVRDARVVEPPTTRDINNRFGEAVDIDGNFAVVGSPYTETTTTLPPVSTPNAGAAYVYEKVNGTWIYRTQLIAQDRDNGDLFGAAVAIKGDYIIVGAPPKSLPNYSYAGAAYIFEKQGNAWVEIKKLTSSNPGFNHQFGFSVDIDGDFAAATEPKPSGSTAISDVYIFKKDPVSGWPATAAPQVITPNPGQQSFDRVAISGNKLIIGDQADDLPPYINCGAVSFYRFNGSNWILSQKLYALDPENTAYLGYSVAIDGDYAIAGSNSTTDATANLSSAITDAGAAYIYHTNNNGLSWTQVRKIVPNDRQQEGGIFFSAAVAISGDIAAVGALSAAFPPNSSQSTFAAGAVYLFQRSNNNWNQLQKIVGDNRNTLQRFGNSVGINGDNIIVGAPYEIYDNVAPGNLDLTGAGAAYFFEKSCLSLKKTASASTVTATTPITYSLELCNACSGTVQNVKIEDVLPLGMVLSNPGNFIYNSGTNSLSTTIASLAPGCTTLVFTATPIIQNNNCGGTGVNFRNCATAEILGSGQAPISSCVNVNVVPGYSTGTVLFSQLINNGTLLPLAGAINTAQTITVYGHWIQDIPAYEFAPTSVIRMGPGAQITVEPNNSLKITKSRIRANACGKLWRSITVKGKLILEECRVQDGQYAVEALHRATIFITNNDFVDNFIGIFVPPSLSSSFPPVSITQIVNFNPLNFTQNRFRSTTPGLLPGFTMASQFPENPRQGQQGLAGIFVNDLLLLDLNNFANTTPNLRNRFSNLNAGIVGFRSNMQINSTTFDNILNNNTYTATGYKGVGIYSNGTGVKCRLFQKGFGPGNGATFSFRDCFDAISTTTVETVVEANKMQNIRRRGVYVELAPLRKHFIANNNIQVIGIKSQGISLQFNNPGPGAIVEQNTVELSNSTSSQADGGILVLENPSGGAHPARLRNNNVRIQNAAAGIVWLGNIDGRAFENNVTLSSNFGGRSGLVSLGSNTSFTCNDVLGTMQSINTPPSLTNAALNQNGFWGFDARNLIACNTFNNTQVGTRFDGANNNVQFKGNRFQDHYYGLWLRPGTTIQPQPFAGNRFMGNPTAPRLEGFNEALITNNLFNVGLPQLTAPQFYPTVLVTINSGWFSYDPNGTDFSCNSIPSFCTNNLPLAPQIQASALDSALALGGFSTNAYLQTNEYKGKRQLYRKLKASGINHPIFQNFSNTQSASPIGQLDKVEELSDSLSTPDSIIRAQGDILAARIEQNFANIHYFDSLYALTSIPVFAAQRDSLQDSTAVLLQGEAALWSGFESGKQTGLNNLSLLNAAISTTAVFEQNDKALNEVYIATIAKGHYDYNSGQLFILNNIASQCPHEGGTAVFYARAMLTLVQDVDLYDLGSCAAEGEKSLERPSKNEGEEDIISENGIFKLYPNPAKDFINLEWTVLLEEGVFIQIFDINGKCINSTKVEQQNNSVQISTSNILAGLYLLRATNESGHTIANFKMVIVR